MHNRNRIYCGDSLETLRKLPEESVHLVITSPPYNLGIEYENADDERPYEDYLKWMQENWTECARLLKSRGRLCINIGENKRSTRNVPTYVAFINQCLALGLLYRGTIIWNKNNAAKHCAWGSWKSPSNPHLVPTHEYVLVFLERKVKIK